MTLVAIQLPWSHCSPPCSVISGPLSNSLGPQQALPSNFPFKFKNKRQLHASFLDVAKSIWNATFEGNPQFILDQKLKALKQDLKSLHKNVFGQMQQRINSAEENVLLPIALWFRSDGLREDLSAKFALHDAQRGRPIHHDFPPVS